MITSKPKSNAIFAIGVFLALTFSLSLVNLNYIIQGAGKWYNILIFLLLFPLALTILIRQILKYKIITINKNAITVKYPFILRVQKSSISNIESWEEIVVDTKNSRFKQLEIIFTNAPKVALSNQENSNYDSIYQFLSRNASGQRIRS